MKYLQIVALLALISGFCSCHTGSGDYSPVADTVLVSDTIQYHPVRINKTDGSILPWFSSDKGRSYDTVLMLVWHFWKNMETDSNGLKYYLNHQVWRPEHDVRGIGGDQTSMALSSWALLYAYTGDPEIIDNMVYLADNYLARSLSKSGDRWPYIPYPYNTDVHSGIYDGDMRNGKDVTQPDKAGTFGYELVNLFKITGDNKYLDAAIRIAQTLSSKITKGDSIKSPLPFRVNAVTGETGSLFDNNDNSRKVRPALYTTNWTGTMMLFEELKKLDQVNAIMYGRSFDIFLEWMKEYPLFSNKWGPFFEDIPGWSDTQTNAVSFAMFIMNHRELFPSWKKDVKSIFDWTYRELGNNEYQKYKVTVMNEQTVYRVPGNSHSSRQASVELMYAELSGDTSYTENAVRTLNWATYTVASDGRNRYIRDDIWLTDGYGDYVRHYLRAMAVRPDLSPEGENHLLGSSSVVRSISYSGSSIDYQTYDTVSTEILRLTMKPAAVKMGNIRLPETEDTELQGWCWLPLESGGVLKINKKEKSEVAIEF
jgi:hypothetical protein